MDIVLAGPPGASPRLLPRGGTYLELGETGIRYAAGVTRDCPGVTYRAADLTQADPGRLGRILAEVAGLLADGRLGRLAMRGWGGSWARGGGGWRPGCWAGCRCGSGTCAGPGMLSHS